MIYFSDLASKVVARIVGWQSKILSFGGKAILFMHVLQSLPTHLLSTISSYSTTINQILSLMADFF